MRHKLLCLAALLACSAFVVVQTFASPSRSPQSAVPQPSPQKAQFFGGTVTGLTNEQITISHAPVGRSAERRTFVINAKTKLNRSALRLKSRVTVRYLHLPEGDVALEILLQPASTRPKLPS